MTNAPANRIVWVDCEMTGLDVDQDGLCEIAIIITDFNLKPVHAGLSIVINPGADVLARMGDFVREMHESSGLLAEIPSGHTPEAAEELAIAYVKKHIPGGSRPLVGGNTIGMDRRFISKYLPKLDAHLHYRSIDVSTIKELARRWHPAAFANAPEKHGGHRALADIAESIRELAYFRDTVLVQAPGPDEATAQRAAERTIAGFQHLLTP